MSKVSLLNISSGVIITLWRLIHLTSEYYKSQITKSEVIRILQSSGFLGGRNPINECINLGCHIKLINIDGKNIELTNKCIDLVLPICDQIDANVEVLRIIIFLILTERIYPWVILFIDDVDIFQTSIPRNWIAILNSADLFNFDNEEVSEWWISLLSNYQDNYEANKKALGDLGEKFTYDFEATRLANDGNCELISKIRWMSKVSDSYGYDIFSFRGSLHKEKKFNKDRIRIEVKSSSKNDERNFSFYISQNEWYTMKQFINSYFVYCWVGVDIENGTYEKGPFILHANDLMKLFPKNVSNKCQWTDCRINIDLSAQKI